MPIMKKNIKKNYSFIETNNERVVEIKSALQLAMFKTTHKEGTYHLSENHCIAYINLYICIDMENGYCLTPNAISWEECLEVINHYE